MPIARPCRLWLQPLRDWEEDLWGIVGLIHDFDYDRCPSLDDHPYKGNAILKERGWPEVISRAVMSHAEYTGVTRDSPMEKALFACDELAGFITAVALIKPSKSLAEVDVKSVRKRMKDKAFARKVNRDDIINGAAALGVDLDEHIALCIGAMKQIAAELGLGRQRRKDGIEEAMWGQPPSAVRRAKPGRFTHAGKSNPQVSVSAPASRPAET